MVTEEKVMWILFNESILSLQYGCCPVPEVSSRFTDWNPRPSGVLSKNVERSFFPWRTVHPVQTEFFLKNTPQGYQCDHVFIIFVTPG